MTAIKEMDDYRMFTAPAELHKAINTLRGIVGGITMDAGTNDREMDELPFNIWRGYYTVC